MLETHRSWEPHQDRLRIKDTGEAVKIIIEGNSDVHFVLTPGWVYYLDSSGNLTSSMTSWPIGLAISETELLLDIDIYGR